MRNMLRALLIAALVFGGADMLHAADQTIKAGPHTCVAGGNDGLACYDDTDCPSGTCTGAGVPIFLDSNHADDEFYPVTHVNPGDTVTWAWTTGTHDVSGGKTCQGTTDNNFNNRACETDANCAWCYGGTQDGKACASPSACTTGGGICKTGTCTGNLAEQWDLGTHTAPFSNTHKFTKPGVYPYLCSLHFSDLNGATPADQLFMTGTIVVDAPTDATLPKIDVKRSEDFQGSVVVSSHVDAQVATIKVPKDQSYLVHATVVGKATSGNEVGGVPLFSSSAAECEILIQNIDGRLTLVGNSGNWGSIVTLSGDAFSIDCGNQPGIDGDTATLTVFGTDDVGIEYLVIYHIIPATATTK